MHDHRAVWSFFKVQKTLIEVHVAFQTREQNSPQGNPADRSMLSDSLVWSAVADKAEEFVQLLGNDAEAAREVTACGIEEIPQMRRQTLVEGRAALRINVNAVA